MGWLDDDYEVRLAIQYTNQPPPSDLTNCAHVIRNNEKDKKDQNVPTGGEFAVIVTSACARMVLSAVGHAVNRKV